VGTVPRFLSDDTAARVTQRFEMPAITAHPLPYAAVAVGIGCFLWLLPTSDRDAGVFAIAVAIGLGVVAAAWSHDRAPLLAAIAVPFGYLLFVGVLRASAGGGASGFGGLLLLPPLWLALSGRRSNLLIGLLGTAAAFFVPLLAVGAPDYPRSGWRGSLVLLVAAAIAGLTIQRLVEEARRHAAESHRYAVDVAEANVMLERQNQLKADFVALAAHELRTPATTIYGFAATLEQHWDKLDPDDLRRLQHTLVVECKRMTRLVEQLLDLSLLDAEAVEIAPAHVNLRERVQLFLPLVAGERLGDVHVEIPSELEVPVDPNALERIVSNLVTNAIRYGAPPITIHAVQQDRHLRVTVEDHGDGVPEQFVPSLFERFSRSDDARALSGGTGLGLAIARSYARAHRGDLVYEPLRPHGARFQLVIPISR
jgi:signal transduction histidine kinase